MGSLTAAFPGCSHSFSICLKDGELGKSFPGDHVNFMYFKSPFEKPGFRFSQAAL